MGLFEQFPYTNYHDLNLDWIIQKVKEAYSPDNPPEFAVLSVNGETGAVVLYKNAVVRLPDIDESTWNLFRKANGTDAGIQFVNGQPAQRIAGTNRYNIYDQGNPPPYPVTSVDGSTGAVTTWANSGNDTLTLPHEAEGDSWTLRREGPSGYLGIEFDLDESDNPSGFFILKPENETIQKVKILTPADIPSESGVVSINGEAGVVVLYAGDVDMASDDSTTVKAAIEGTRALTAAPYDSTASYSAGDFCVYQGVFYVCTASTTGSWDSTKWTATTVDYQLKAINSSLATANTNISAKANKTMIAGVETGSSATRNYNKDDYIVISNSLYKAITSISNGTTFSGSNVSEVTVGAELKRALVPVEKSLTVYDARVTDFNADRKTTLIKLGEICILTISCKLLKNMTTSQSSIYTLPADCIPMEGEFVSFIRKSGGSLYILQVANTGTVNIEHTDAAFSTGDTFFGQIIFTTVL